MRENMEKLTTKRLNEIANSTENEERAEIAQEILEDRERNSGYSTQSYESDRDVVRYSSGYALDSVFQE